MAVVGCSNMASDVWNGQVCLIDIASGGVMHSWTTYCGVSCLEWCGADYSFLAVGGDDGAINLHGLSDSLLALQFDTARAKTASANTPAAAKAGASTASAASKPAKADKTDKSAPAGAAAQSTAKAKSTAMHDDDDGEYEPDEDGDLKDLSPISHVTTLYDHSDIVSALVVCPAQSNQLLSASWDQTYVCDQMRACRNDETGLN